MEKHLCVSVLGTGWIMKKLYVSVLGTVWIINTQQKWSIQAHLLTYGWFESPPLFLSLSSVRTMRHVILVLALRKRQEKLFKLSY